MIVPEKRNLGPHIGVVKFNIFVHKMLDDGSIDPQIIDCSNDFKDNEMSNLGEIHVVGFDKWDCIKKVKKLLESLSKKNGKI